MTRGGVAQTRTFVYNGWDMVSATNPENGTVTYTYDNAHHVTNRTDALGQQTQYTYDSYGRLTEVQYFLLDMWHNLNEDTTQRVTYSYDNANQFTQNGLGRLSQVTFGGGVADDFNDSYYYLYSYNTAGRVTSQQMAVQTLVNGLHGPQLNTWITFTANYQWDNEGRMTSLQYPTVSLPNNPPWETSFTLQTAAYQYDVNGRMTGMTWDSGNGPQPYASATYGPAGQMLTLSYGAGTETRQYNSLLQLTSQSVPGYLNMTYNYSAGQNNGRIVGSVDGITGENTTYTYDALNRLSSATASGMWSEQYSYDGFGNLTGKSQTGGAPSMGANYNAQNQQVGGGAAYDANGNQTTANNTTNVFTVENRIKSQASTAWPYPQLAEYAYDPWGRRVMTQTDADPNNPDSTASWQFNFYGITGQRLVTLGCTNPSANPLPNCTVQGQNVYFGRKLLVSNGVTVVTDRLGSVRANTQGEKFAYYPYGEERTVTVDSREKFGTYFRDGVGQDYAMARYYGAGTGRFWSPDPGGIKTADPGTPPSWNRYGYVNGDPVNHTDRHGLLVDVFDCDSDSCWEGEDASDYWDGWGIEPMPEQPVPTATANERRKRQLAIIAAYNAIAGAIANLAAQANKVATWPLYIQEVSMCSKSSLSGIELDVTYQVYNDLGQPMTSNLDGFSITEQFLDQIGNMSNLNQTAGTWTRSNNTLFTNGQFIDVLTTGGLAGTQSATALQEFTATGWFGVQPLGISVGGADVNGVNYNTYSSTNVTVDGKGATGPCSGN
jgi:RHS repeat-associated protein